MHLSDRNPKRWGGASGNGLLHTTSIDDEVRGRRSWKPLLRRLACGYCCKGSYCIALLCMFT
jgi:hypothetical protein